MDNDKFVPREVPEGINASQEHPLKLFSILLVGVAGLVAVFFLVLNFASSWLVSYVSLERELDWGSTFYAEENTSEDPQRKKVSELVHRLWQPFDQGRGLQLFVETNPTKAPNAFIAPGGLISVTKGLLEQTESENELAFVLCHELGHFYHRHALQSASNALGMSLILSLVGLSSDSLGVFQQGLQLTALSYSRENESQADAFALDCLHAQYGHLQDHDQFFKKILELQGFLENVPGSSYFSTHPPSQERLDEMLEIARSRGLPLTGEAREW